MAGSILERTLEGFPLYGATVPEGRPSATIIDMKDAFYAAESLVNELGPEKQLTVEDDLDLTYEPKNEMPPPSPRMGR